MIMGWFFMISNQLVNSDSNYKFMTSVIDGLDKNNLYVIFFPQNKNIRYEDDGFFDNPRILPIIQRSPSQKTHQSIYFDSGFVYQKGMQYGINVMFNNIIEVMPQMHQTFRTFRNSKIPYLVGYPHYTIHPSIGYPMFAYEGLRLLGCLGNYMSHLLLYNSRYHYSMLEDNLKEFHLDKWIEPIKNKTEYVGIPVYDSEMKKHTPETKYDPDNIKYYYNHRLQNYKRWTDTFDLFTKLYNKGYNNLEVLLSYNSGDYTKEVSSKPYVRLQKTHTHNEYYEKLSQPHFNTINTIHETFCISIVESGLLGGIPIIPKTVTFPELFPKNYQYYYNTPTEQEEIIKNTLNMTKKDIPQYQEDNTKIREHLLKYDTKIIGKNIQQIIQKGLEDEAKNILHQQLKKQHRTNITKILKQNNGETIPLRELTIQIRNKTGLGRQALPDYILTTILEILPHHKEWDHKNKQLNITPHLT